MRIGKTEVMKKWLNIILNIIFGGICLILLWLLGQIFLFASFRIPSDSMSPTLREGDFVLVWKPIVGARIFNLHKSLNLEQTDIYRLPGFRKVCRNDVVVFNFPHPNDWNHIEMHILKYYIKRCIGLPGDTLSIKNGMFHVNGFDEPLGNILSQEQVSLFTNKDYPKVGYRSFPFDSLLNWNIKRFGPLYIPKNGDNLKLDYANYILYRKMIEWEQKGKLEIREKTILLNDSLITEYRFQKNYYFVAGDNGKNSQDSRYWGLLPEEYIVGVASRIWKSEDRYTGEIRWSRIWNKIE